MTKRILILLCCLAVLPSALALDLDYERETRWAEQVLPSILVGDPVWIEQPNGQHEQAESAVHAQPQAE